MLEARHLIPERMDDPALDAPRHRQALRGLQRLNRLARSVRIVWEPVRELATAGVSALPRPAAPLRVLDVATGAGDLPVALWRLARRQDLPMQIDGCDRSDTALAFARHHAQQLGAPINWFALDALRDPLPTDYDVILCSLFLHHLTDLDAVTLLRRLGQAARRLLVVHDLQRSPMGWLFAHAGSRLVSRSPIVHADAPQSVRAGYTAQELEFFARLAGLGGFAIRQRWPCRLVLTCPGR
jgi:2-polyprenyl-3-methyl-5-hydroxy-6-metoxy-1,4-benzoquinol methylase